MTDKQIIIDGLACVNCPEAKRCQEQQAKKEYAINQVLQDIPAEYANVIARLKQIIPSVTRCDYVLEKQLKRKEQECENLREKYLGLKEQKGSYIVQLNTVNDQLDQLKVENDELKRKCKQAELYRDVFSKWYNEEFKLKRKNKADFEKKKIELNNKINSFRIDNKELKEELSNAEQQLDQLKAENKTQKEAIDGFLTILDKLGKSNIKLRETLTEIKEIVYLLNDRTMVRKDICDRLDIILQKISEVEDG